MINIPDTKGYFGKYGGRFVPETLMEALLELENNYKDIYAREAFQNELNDMLHNFAGRPTPLYHAERLSSELGIGNIFLKREDLCHTGAHKINNCVGQALFAKHCGKNRIVAETGAGQHGVATAAVCANLGLNCVVYMGARDMERQRINVQRMRFFGAEVRPVHQGSQTLKDAINEALRDWITNVESTHYLIGSVVGPHPYPMIVRNFQKIIGEEVKAQLQNLNQEAGILIAAVGGGSNAIGLFYTFLESSSRLIGVEAGGENEVEEKHSATLKHGLPGILHGSYTYVLQRNGGQISETESVAPGLDYAAVGPEHSYLKDSGRVEYVAISDSEAIDTFQLLNRVEGILPALESCHAVAYLKKLKPMDRAIVVNLSGRGDKDLAILEGKL
ncbi:MAG TPA: tryptophan synthase subunit beta [Acidobacteriota bacterium]|nr:tryptophan synthase subunit beta [Acidobacteriota bacterium]